MPRLWTDSIDAHRRDVRAAILDATAELITEHGVLAVSMSHIAERAGIGRATLYKYFADLGVVVQAWHERQVEAHIELLRRQRDPKVSAVDHLHAVLSTYARLQHERHGHGHGHGEPVTALHTGQHVAQAHRHLRAVFIEALTEAAKAGAVRSDMPAMELAEYCVHALSAAGALPSAAAVQRLVTLTLRALEPDHG